MFFPANTVLSPSFFKSCKAHGCFGDTVAPYSCIERFVRQFVSEVTGQMHMEVLSTGYQLWLRHQLHVAGDILFYVFSSKPSDIFPHPGVWQAAAFSSRSSRGQVLESSVVSAEPHLCISARQVCIYDKVFQLFQSKWMQMALLKHGCMWCHRMNLRKVVSAGLWLKFQNVQVAFWFAGGLPLRQNLCMRQLILRLAFLGVVHGEQEVSPFDAKKRWNVATVSLCSFGHGSGTCPIILLKFAAVDRRRPCASNTWVAKGVGSCSEVET